MLTELRRYSSIGSIKGILTLVAVITGRPGITESEILNLWSIRNYDHVNCNAAIKFFGYLKLINNLDGLITPTPEFINISRESPENIIMRLSELSIKTIIDEGVFNRDSVAFESEYGLFCIKSGAFPLSHSVLRNFLTDAGVFVKKPNGSICISETYEKNLTEEIKSRRVMSIELLNEQNMRQAEQGLEAEEFVLMMERKRLPEMSSKIKRISDFDVSAGYDIASYANNQSHSVDRFIEVKCYKGEPHFYWSSNEMEVASEKGKKYVLCLVDYDCINSPGYIPEFIEDPYAKLTEKLDGIPVGFIWDIRPASYFVRKLKL